MNSLPRLFVGILATFLTAWLGLVAFPFLKFSTLNQEKNEETGELLPPTPNGLARQGARVYAANGCIYCHTQQVRPEYQGSDIARGWGARRTVPRDYIHEQPVFLGTMRTGPDLTNIGARQSNREWQYQHLYDPQTVSPGSTMPPFRFLFEKRKITGQPSPNAFTVPGHSVEEGYEIVPTHEAQALVEYLISLNHNYSLKEAPVK